MMIMSILLLAGSAAATPSVTPPNPDWNCDAPMAQQEMNWCAHQDYLATDAKLNAQWKINAEAMKKLDSTEGIEGGRLGYFETMLQAQRAWIVYRDTHCANVGYQMRGGSIEPLLVSVCKAELTETRIQQLKELLDGVA